MEKELGFTIAGEAGQGLITIGNLLVKIFSRGGWFVFSSQDYESRIRGGHNIFKICLAQEPIQAGTDRLDILIALNEESISLHLPELSEKSLVIYDGEKITPSVEKKGHLIGLPIDRLAKEAGSSILANIVAVAATLGLLDYELAPLLQYIDDFFQKKGDSVIQQNHKAAELGYAEGKQRCLDKGGCVFTIHSLSRSGRMVINGGEATALGALAAGCKFYSAYPMTPSTSVFTFMAAKADQFGVLVEQAEDEIAAINMVIGASFAGVRAMTGTSGGGFALMVEGLSLAAMTETPIVIFLGQRPGPATGLPTKTEQADLHFAIQAGHGEFPRLIYAPGNPEEAFYLAAQAFQMAEKYQIPVILLSDQYLADSSFTLEKELDPHQIIIDRHLLSTEELSHLNGKYQRYAFTESGISPRAIPGQGSHLVMTDSDEHDEYGHIIEDAKTRNKQIEKRLKKWRLMSQDTIPPTQYGDPQAKNLLISWGSTWGIVLECMNRLVREGKNLGMLHFSQLWPFPVQQFIELAKGRDGLICIENNATGQLAYLIQSESRISVSKSILQADGRPFSIDYLVKRVREVIG